ncbi:unnamed protein product [Adineta ricciae]|uniref:Uncharacterized protein n=1 Tax=Adineta ricciae TaxID=249248 RepID=A0A813Y4U3_ADIRI|nr:unnamed protein product [Adineta ricciae]CAF0897252.1 unnamed protein product [Adineta ricciae]
MPTSSQSQILSVVDGRLLQQQQFNDLNGGKKLSIRKRSAVRVKRKQSRETRRISTKRKNENSSTACPRNSSRKVGKCLHMPVINLYSMINGEANSSMNETKDEFSSVITISDNHVNDSIITDSENLDRARRPSLLNENTRRLPVLSTIRPSKTFYRDLPEADVDELMEYFRRMKNTKMTSEAFNQEYQTQFKDYKLKIFFDSSHVTKTQVKTVEKLFASRVNLIRTCQAELIQVDRSRQFAIRKTNSEKLLTIIPREYNDCLLTLITRSNPLRRSNLVSELVQDQFYEEIKANSLDISYFPGGVNYEIPQEEIERSDEISTETYKKLKKRLSNRQVRYFSRPPEKRPCSLLAILPTNCSTSINHQQLLECLYDRLKTLFTNDKIDIKQRILSVEFLPLTCILDSNRISNQYIINCDTINTKQQLMSKPVKLHVNKQLFYIELHSYDEDLQKEYEKFLQEEKYRELIRN